MARTTRTASPLAQPSVLVTPWQVDNANGEQFPYAGGRNKLVVTVAATPVTVTVRATTGAPGVLPDGNQLPDKVVVVGANTTRVIWEAATEVQADGNVYVDYSATAATILAYVIQG